MIITKIDSFIPQNMESLFSAILSQSSHDPRSLILPEVSSLVDWLNPQIEFSELGYNRKVLFKNEFGEEIVLATWKKNQFSPFHYHTNQSCWIYMIDGTLEETRVKSSDFISIPSHIFDWAGLEMNFGTDDVWSEIKSSKQVSLVSAGEWNYIDDTLGFHRMEATSDYVASLHIYRNLNSNEKQIHGAL